VARIRTIKPQFFTSEDVTALAPLARLLFVGLFTECDRDGRVEDRPKTLKMRLLPGDDVDVDDLLWCLVDGGLIRRYEASGGVRVIQVRAFAKHQKPHPKEADSILPADGQDREKPHLNTASRDQVVILPVENPSCPQSSLREGVLDPLREGKGTTPEPPPLRPLVSGESSPKGWGKIHGDHVAGFCDWVCLPDFIFSEFVRKSSGADYVREWAKSIRAKFEGQTVGDNLKFWRVRWSETHPEAGTNGKPVAKSVEQIIAEVAALDAADAARKAARS